MTQYNIFKHPSGATETVKEGWSWPAFFFTAFWALWKKMWLLGVAVLVGAPAVRFSLPQLAVWADQGYYNDIIPHGVGLALNILALILPLPIALVFGAKGNMWREKHLIARGFDYVRTVTSDWESARVAKAEPEDVSGIDESLLGACENCLNVIRLNVEKCPHCGALYGPHSAWKVKPL